jgi:hypothetical protein
LFLPSHRSHNLVSNNNESSNENNNKYGKCLQLEKFGFFRRDKLRL